MKSQFEFDSFNEVQVKGYCWSNPETKPRGILILSHGMAESILRYDQFAEFLVKSNIFVYGHSHRGHFETAGSQERLGYLGENGWSKMVSDLNQVVEMAKNAYPGVPVYLMGHSMGSFVTRDYLIEHSTSLDGVILSGTGYPAKFELSAGAAVAKMELFFKREDKPSKLLNSMSFGSYNKKIDPLYTEFDWLSRDKAMVQAYIDSPWCGQLHPTSFFADMASNLVRILYQPTFKTLKPLPMLVMSGDCDPVGQYGKGVIKTADYYKNLNFKVTTTLYKDGRHEMLNELNREAVAQDILDWLNLQI